MSKKNSLNILTRIVKFLFLLSGLLFCAYLIALNLPQKFYYKFKHADTYTNIDYGSSSQATSQSSIKEFRQKDIRGFKDIAISFAMKTYSIDDHNNVFQTAPFNSGIRMELSKPSTLVLIVKSNTSSGFAPIILTKSIKLNKWYNIAINIDRLGHVKIILDNEQIVNWVDRNLDFAVSDIMVGAGFDKTRVFKGKISNFKLSLKVFEKMNLAKIKIIKYVFDITLLFAIGLLIWLKKAKIWNFISKYFRVFDTLFQYPLDREEKMNLFSLVIIAGFFLSTVFHYMKGMFYNFAYPINTFLPNGVTRYGDFYGAFSPWVVSGFRGTVLAYFPSVFLILDIFARINRDPYRALAIYLTVFCCFLLVYAYKNLKSISKFNTLRNIIAVFMSYPVLFTIHTGNLESFVFIFLCLFIYFYQKEKNMLGCLFLGMAISMKIFPAVFFILMLSDKKYKQILYTMLWTLVLTVVPLAMFGGLSKSGFSNYLANLMTGQKFYKELMIISSSGNHYGHSLLNAVRVLSGNSMPPMSRVLMPYLVLSLIVFIALSLFIILYENIFWKKVALLIIAMNVLPYTSTDYKLTHLLIPLFLFINYTKKEGLDFLYVLLFSLILIPKDYYVFPWSKYYNLNTVLNPAIMLAILFLIVFQRLKINSKKLPRVE